jgi:hypothetical protein
MGIDRRQSLGQLVGLLFAVEVSKPLVRTIFTAGIHAIELGFDAKGCGGRDALLVAFALHDVALDLHQAAPISGQGEARLPAPASARRPARSRESSRHRRVISCGAEVGSSGSSCSALIHEPT